MMDDIVQHVDLGHKQACIDLEKATQYIIKALQHEIGQNQELCVLIRRLEEEAAETGRSFTEQVEANKQLKLQIDELHKHLEEKHSSLGQANQTVTLLKNELRDLRHQLQSIRSEVERMGACGWSDPLVSSDTLSLLVPQIKEENAGHGYEECNQSERIGLRTEQTSSSAADIKTEQIQMSPISSDGRRHIDAPVSEDGGEDYTHSGKGAFPSLSPSRPETSEKSKPTSPSLSPSRPETSEKSKRTSPSLSPSHPETSEKSKRTSPSLSPSRPETSEKSKRHVCALCIKSYRSLFELQTHQCVREARERLYPCTDCSKRFTCASALKRHQRTHTRERPYHCTLCGKSFIQVSHLKQHKGTHTGERPYSCSQCGKSFTRNCDRIRHQYIHTRERPYSCAHCGTRVIVKYPPKFDQLTPAGETTFSNCIQCGKALTGQHPRTHRETKPLRKPRRTHMEGKPYQCTQCEKGFTYEGAFTRHQGTHIGEEPLAVY